MIFDNQSNLELTVAAVACFNEEFLKEPTLTLELFTQRKNQLCVRTCKEVLEKRGTLDMDEISMKLADEGLADYFAITLYDHAYEQSLFYKKLKLLYQNLEVRKMQEMLEGVVQETMTAEDFKAKINSLEMRALDDENNTMNVDEMFELIQSKEDNLQFSKIHFFKNIVQPRKQTVNVIGARTGIGKTAYALNILADLMKNYKCLYFNLELPEIEVFKRLNAIISGVSIYNFDNMTSEEQTKTFESCFAISSRKVEVYSGSLSMEKIRKIVGKKARNEHCIVFVDHIGYVRNSIQTNTRERVQQTMIELNALSKDFDCTVFALSQLNREVEGQPALTNLKDSGEIEQTASSVVLLSSTEIGDYDNMLPEYHIVCAKNRGKMGVSTPIYNRLNQRFIDDKDGKFEI